MSIVGLWAGRVLAGVGVICAATSAAFGLPWLILGGGLVALGLGLGVVGGHRTRRPPRHVEVIGARVIVRPEGVEHTVAALGPLTIREWTFQRTDASDTLITSRRAALRSEALDLELYLGESQAECAAWQARFEAAVAGGPAPAVKPIDRLLEQPPAGLVLALGLVGLGALGAGGWLYTLADPHAVTVAGVACLMLGAVWGLVAIERPWAARVMALLGAGVLIARPIARPVVWIFEGVPETLGLFATPHLSFLASGVGLLVLGLIAARPAGGRTAA